jgi:hypothetical protein
MLASPSLPHPNLTPEEIAAAEAEILAPLMNRIRQYGHPNKDPVIARLFGRPYPDSDENVPTPDNTNNSEEPTTTVTPPTSAPVDSTVTPPTSAPVDTTVIPPTSAPVDTTVIPPTSAPSSSDIDLSNNFSEGPRELSIFPKELFYNLDFLIDLNILPLIPFILIFLFITYYWLGNSFYPIKYPRVFKKVTLIIKYLIKFITKIN